ncbi:hypothetical protein E1A91_D08G239400v1 [Gossypium mustelinum]|uniref:Vacuolar fusion protein MON1 homolog n=1 Tax=Gossypium mustelinum TaxID=34275 RepID=A0A5D2TZC3_GOSMU|nr:hypothetical protein E1A91_D08G239400v1 [Gossypium mustelinum]TYI70693.1 hypothetical protein E1A91_D08G239400v1 [Gossypium mustelinum]
MDSVSSSSSLDDSTQLSPNSDPKDVEQRFDLLSVTDEPIQSEPSHRGNGDGFTNGSLNPERSTGDEDDDQLVEDQELVADEGPSSPNSCSYAGERGSASATSVSRIDAASDIDDIEIQGVRNESSFEGISDSQPSSGVPGKHRVDEDDASISWRKRKKHFFILSNSGKPIYSRYGDEHKLAGFSATLQAIISFMENGGDRVKLVKAGKHQVVFVVKGPIYLVCISCNEEPFESLKGQLELIYGQMILILTKSINRSFEKNPKFDMTHLLGGTDDVFSSLIHSFSWNPATFLHAYTCLPLAYATRQAAGAILQDVADSGVLFAILMCKHKVISLVGAQKASLHPDDILLLSNFVMSSESFRTSESFSPICLPRYNPLAFLHAYVHFLDVDTYLMLLTTSSDAFYHLKDCRIRIETVLLKSNILSEVQRSLLDGGIQVEDLHVAPLPRSGPSPHQVQQILQTDSPERPREPFVGIGGPAGLWHFIYRSISRSICIHRVLSTTEQSSATEKELGHTKLSSKGMKTMFYYAGSRRILNSMRHLIPLQTRQKP